MDPDYHMANEPSGGRAPEVGPSTNVTGLYYGDNTEELMMHYEGEKHKA